MSQKVRLVTLESKKTAEFNEDFQELLGQEFQEPHELMEPQEAMKPQEPMEPQSPEIP